MKDWIHVAIITMALFACADPVPTASEEISIITGDTSVSNKLNGDVLSAEAGIVLMDIRLLEFAKHYLNPGANTYTIRYQYNTYRDTLFDSPADSIIIYSYPVDSIVKFYGWPFIWADEYIQERREVTKALPQLLGSMGKALSCQGLIYSFGDQMIESFSFSSVEEAVLAKSYFDDMNGWLFPKTLSFASQKDNRLYVFHARYNAPSWSSKKDHARFEKFMNENHSESYSGRSGQSLVAFSISS